MPGQECVDPLPRGQRRNLRGNSPRQHDRVPAAWPAARHDDHLRLAGTLFEQPGDHAIGVMPAASPGASSTWSGGAGSASVARPISIESRISAGRTGGATTNAPACLCQRGDGRPLLGIVRRRDDHDAIGASLPQCGHDAADQRFAVDWQQQLGTSHSLAASGGGNDRGDHVAPAAPAS